MSATDELRRLLDERGVKHYDGQGYTAWGKERRFSADENTNGTFCLHMFMFDCTPAQAIEISLGRGNCKTIAMDCFGNPPFNQSGLNGNSTAVGCSECGAPWSTCGLFRGNQLKHNFKACPICGREVEQ